MILKRPATFGIVGIAAGTVSFLADFTIWGDPSRYDLRMGFAGLFFGLAIGTYLWLCKRSSMGRIALFFVLSALGYPLAVQIAFLAFLKSNGNLLLAYTLAGIAGGILVSLGFFLNRLFSASKIAALAGLGGILGLLWFLLVDLRSSPPSRVWVSWPQRGFAAFALHHLARRGGRRCRPPWAKGTRVIMQRSDRRFRRGRMAASPDAHPSQCSRTSPAPQAQDRTPRKGEIMETEPSKRIHEDVLWMGIARGTRSRAECA